MDAVVTIMTYRNLIFVVSIKLSGRAEHLELLVLGLK